MLWLIAMCPWPVAGLPQGLSFLTCKTGGASLSPRCHECEINSLGLGTQASSRPRPLLCGCPSLRLSFPEAKKDTAPSSFPEGFRSSAWVPLHSPFPGGRLAARSSSFPGSNFSSFSQREEIQEREGVATDPASGLPVPRGPAAALGLRAWRPRA